MQELFKERLDELNFPENEKKFILDNIELFTMVYFQGMKDSLMK